MLRYWENKVPELFGQAITMFWGQEAVGSNPITPIRIIPCNINLFCLLPTRISHIMQLNLFKEHFCLRSISV